MVTALGGSDLLFDKHQDRRYLVSPKPGMADDAFFMVARSYISHPPTLSSAADWRSQRYHFVYYSPRHLQSNSPANLPSENCYHLRWSNSIDFHLLASLMAYQPSRQDKQGQLSLNFGDQCRTRNQIQAFSIFVFVWLRILVSDRGRSA
jgi:hypothetical protein